MSPVRIVGMGAVCSAGHGVDAGFRAVAEGRDGLTALSVVDAELKTPPLCGQLPRDPNELLESRVPNRSLACSVVAAEEALAPLNNRRGDLSLAVVAATTVAGMTRSEAFYRNYIKDHTVVTHASRELRYHEPTTLTAELARRYGASLSLTVSTACSTGLHALGLGKRLIDKGRCDLVLAVGADALSLLTVRGFASLTLVAPDGCRPFDKRRAGISLGEGAGVMVLASERAAETLGVETLGYVSGWGASADCHHMTAPHPEGRGAAAAMSAALAEAGIEPAQVDYIAAHGTGTPDNDLAEAKALQAVFGTVPPFSSMKRTLGHTLGASGTLEAVLAVQAMREGRIPASGGFEIPDENIALEPSGGETGELTHVVKNAFGFGGNNASVVLSRGAA